MARALPLKYHQATFHFLDKEPKVSAAAQKKIAAAEKRMGLQLPASVREWYSLAGWETMLSRHRAQVLAEEKSKWPVGLASLKDLLKNLEQMQSMMRSDFGVGWEPMFTVGSRPGDPYSWYVALDGSDDPPVVEIDREQFQIEARFSVFIFARVWEPYDITIEDAADADGLMCWLLSEKHYCNPYYLDFLRERYNEGLLSENAEEKRLYYRFYNSDGAITIKCNGDPMQKEVAADWTFSAASTGQLVNLIAPLSPWKDLFADLRCTFSRRFGLQKIESEGGKEALKQLRPKSRKK